MIQAKTALRSLLESFVFGNVLVALCGIVLSLSTYLILGIPFSEVSVPVLTLVFFSCLFIYNLNVFFLGEFDVNVAREKWKSDHLKAVKIFTLFCMLPVLFYASLLSLPSLLILAHLFLLAILYVIPLKWNGKSYSFRKIPLLKLFVLAYVWSCVTVVLPAVEYGLPPNEFLFLERFVFILAISIPFDIRDFDRDREQSTLTIPVWMGKKNAMLLSLLLVIVFMIFSVFYYSWNFIALARVISGGLACLFILNSHKLKNEFYFLVILDGLMLLHFLILYGSKTFYSVA